MIRITIKDGVRFHTGGHAAALSHMTMIVAQVLETHGAEYCEITGGVEKHEHRSLHVHGDALDYKSNHLVYADDGSPLLGDSKIDVAIDIAKCLGDGYDFFWESDTGQGEHFHGEYQPKDWHR
jgi:hypothetical protein